MLCWSVRGLITARVLGTLSGIVCPLGTGYGW